MCALQNLEDQINTPLVTPCAVQKNLGKREKTNILLLWCCGPTPWRGVQYCGTVGYRLADDSPRYPGTARRGKPRLATFLSRPIAHSPSWLRPRFLFLLWSSLHRRR